MLGLARQLTFASLTWICVAEQLYTDTAFMLDASTHVAAAAVGRRKLPRRSALALRRRHMQMGRWSKQQYTHGLALCRRRRT